jgi:hypothetical protein
MTNKEPAIMRSEHTQRLRDQNYREVYSNNCMQSMTPFDIKLIFQKLSEIIPGQPALIDEVSVIISPPHFKALINSLTETLNAYENSFGHLTIPDAYTEPTNTASQLSELIKNDLEARKKKAP